MKDVSLWAAGISAAAVAGAMLGILVPSGNMKKTYSFLLSAVLLMMIVKPLTQLPPLLEDLKPFRGRTQRSEDFSNYVNFQTTELIREELEDAAARILWEAGIPFENVEAHVDILEDGSVYMNKITVECEAAYAVQIQLLLTEKLQLQTEAVIK